jgi:ketosteroid isomerase-like protein
MPASTIHPSIPKRSARPAPFLAAVLLLAVCIGPVALHAGMPRAQKHERRHEIDQLEETWRQAVLKSNTAVMDGLLADDYMAVTASGTLQTKEQALASLRAGRMHLTTLDISDRKVRFYGSTALVTSVAEVQGTTSEGEVSGSYRYIRVYVRNAQGAWKIVSFEVSKIREPGEHNEHK